MSASAPHDCLFCAVRLNSGAQNVASQPTSLIYHPDGSAMLHHFIRPSYLIELLECRAFRLGRQDQQSDPADGKLPAASFEDPHIGPLEAAVGANAGFLKSQARALDVLRAQTFIMSWTLNPSGRARDVYGENGARCELTISELNLKLMLGYEFPAGCEFPPPRRPIPELGGIKSTAQIKPAFYTDGAKAISVVPAYFATAHKSDNFAEEEEIRIEVISPIEGGVISPNVCFIKWPIATFSGLSISLTDKTSDADAARIAALVSEVGASMNR